MLKKLIFIPLIFSWGALASTKLDKATLNEYLKLQKTFNESMCTPEVTKQFDELTLAYKGDGNFIPLTTKGEIDEEAISKNLDLFKEKILWLEQSKSRLELMENFDDLTAIVKKIKTEYDTLLDQNKKHFFQKDPKKKEAVLEEAKKNYQNLLTLLDEFSSKAPYLFSFTFPIDHLDLRAQYDKNRDSGLDKSKHLANVIYLKRKIVQDGAFDLDLQKNDTTIRAAFDTLYLSLKNDPNKNLLTEINRSDLLFIINNYKLLLEIGPKVYAERFGLWIERTKRAEAFYQGLVIEHKNKKNKKLTPEEFARKELIKKMLADRADALLNLKKFSLTQQAKTYEFWAGKSELYQYLYAMETILYAEGGRLDAPDALERNDIAKIVVNRFENPKYNFLSKDDSIDDYIPAKVDTKKHKWLNVLFKEGEFSFTYFYIPGNFHIYCPDMSKVGQFLRRENLRIGIDQYGQGKPTFKALRYYSRNSMYGRIQMDSIWTEYKALNPMPGKSVKNPKQLHELYASNNFRFYYNFTGLLDKKEYYVVEMNKKVYVVDSSNTNKIYYYRNPHHFKYFEPLK